MGSWTAPISATASAGEVQAALEGLAGIEEVEVASADAGLTVSEAAALGVTSSGTKRSWVVTFGASGETELEELGNRPLLAAAWTLEAYASIDGSAYPAADLAASPPQFAWRGLESPAADPRPAVEVSETVAGQNGNILQGVQGTDDVRDGDFTFALRRRSGNGTDEVYVAMKSVFELRCSAYNGSFVIAVDGAASGSDISGGASASASNPSRLGYPSNRAILSEVLAANTTLPALQAVVQRLYARAAGLAGLSDAQINAISVSVQSTDEIGSSVFNLTVSSGVPA